VLIVEQNELLAAVLADALADEGGRVRQAGVDSWCSEGIHRHFSPVALRLTGSSGAMDGPSDGAATAIAAVKPCAFGAPLCGFGA
jgi:hypothetical protein